MPGEDSKRTAAMPASMLYKQVKQAHPCYEPDRYRTLELLYEGGWAMMREAKTYCPPQPMEHPRRYDARTKVAAYAPYFGQIVDQFVSDLFAQPLTVNPAGDKDNPDTPGEPPDAEYYADFADDVDGEGHGVEEVAGAILTTALKHRRAYLMVDAPESPEDAPPPMNRAESEERGLLRLYAYEVPPCQVLDWKEHKEKDREGKKVSCFDWVVLYTREQERETPTGDRSTIVETFTFWTLIGPPGARKARFDKYQLAYAEEIPPTEETPVPWVAGGETAFDRIPLLIFEVSEGLWVGNKIGPLALEHYVRRSELVGAMSAGCVEIPWVALGPEVPAVGEGQSAATEDEHRGDDPVAQYHAQGFLKLGLNEKLEFAGPKGHIFEVTSKDIDHTRETMYAVNHQMAASVRPNATALGRSGLSKQKDQDKTDKVLGAFGRIVRAFWERVYDTVSFARKDPLTVWVASGLDNYETYDRVAVITEATQIGQVAIPSPTFRKEHCKRVASALVPGLPPQTVSVIVDEIDKGVDADEEKRQLQNETDKKVIKAQGDQAANPPAPGAKVPGFSGGDTSDGDKYEKGD